MRPDVACRLCNELTRSTEATAKKIKATARRREPQGPLKNFVASRSIGLFKSVVISSVDKKVTDKNLLVYLRRQTGLMSNVLILLSVYEALNLVKGFGNTLYLL